MDAGHGERPLPEQEVASRLSDLPSWAREGRCIVRDLTFRSWAECIAFVNRVARCAEEMNHHPDIALSWRRATIRLTSHDEAGITMRDFRLAGMIDRMIPPDRAGTGRKKK